MEVLNLTACIQQSVCDFFYESMMSSDFLVFINPGSFLSGFGHFSNCRKFSHFKIQENQDNNILINCESSTLTAHSGHVAIINLKYDLFLRQYLLHYPRGRLMTAPVWTIAWSVSALNVITIIAPFILRFIQEIVSALKKS